MLNRILMAVALATSIFASIPVSGAPATDYSKEAVVVERMATSVQFSAEGSRVWRQTFAVRVQSEAVVRQFGVLGFGYNSENEQIEVEYVRVRKADGSVIETPSSSVMDVATAVATAAPTYSDLRQKQIPVKALGVGDVLEYAVRKTESKPEVPGQFWYEQPFITDAVVLVQSLEIRVPESKYVQVSSQKLRPVERKEGGERVFSWTYSQLKPSVPADKKSVAKTEDEPLKVQLTTFRSWQEVGEWWGALAKAQAKVTPAIESKAKELTAGLSSDEEKARAIYKYVAMKFRYISISFGEGRYRPHSAEDVLANQYGDCKDKHTLLAALLKAAGIEAWPALIGAGLKFDPSVPSPAQFNHVITVLPQKDKYVWLDTTAEVAPFGLLLQTLRDQQALVISATGSPVLMKTPVDPPFSASQLVDVKAALDGSGTLTGHFDFRMAGDEAVAMRAGFHQLAPAQWQLLAQQFSYGLGYSGEVSGVEVEQLENLDEPLHYGYDYKREKFSDWENRRIAPALPPLGFGPGEEAEKPAEDFWTGAPGEQIYRSSMKLPGGFSVELPHDAKVSSAFADYSSHYTFKDGTLVAERRMTIKRSKVKPAEWAAYQAFEKDVRADQNQFASLTESSGQAKTIAPDINPEAVELLRRAYNSMQTHDVNAARDLVREAERINPKQPGLWAMYGYLDEISGKQDEAIADLRKELLFHPEEQLAQQQLAALFLRADRSEEAIQLWRGVLARQPKDRSAATALAGILVRRKRYGEVAGVLEQAIAAAPDDYSLQATRADALLRNGEKEKGVAEAERIAAATSDPAVLNNVAYSLADTGADLGEAQSLAEKAVAKTEEACGKATLASFENQDLKRVESLAADWDTLGWVYFKRGDLRRAEKYITASWTLSQEAEVANHLGELYDKQGRHDEAAHSWRLALAANSHQEAAKENLREAGAPVVEPRRAGATGRRLVVPPAEELGRLRTAGVPKLAKQTGSAEFFVLFTRVGVEDAQFITGSDALKDASQAIKAMKADFVFPDNGPEKIIRRGILSCSAYTNPSCQLTVLLPTTVRKGTGPN